MDLERPAELAEFGSTLRRMLAAHYSPNDRLRILETDIGWSREVWARCARLGIFGLALDSDSTSSGVAELSVVMEEMGRVLALEPFLATAIGGATLVVRTADPELQAHLAPRIESGEHLVTIAHQEPMMRTAWSPLDARATNDGTSWRVSGEKSVVAGDCADSFVVSALCPDGHPGLFYVQSSEVTRQPYRRHDATRGADVTLKDASALPMCVTRDAAGILDDVLELQLTLLCVEAVAVMDQALVLTVDYLKAREQFGKPLAAQQVLQHRAADMYVALEQARSLALLAQLAFQSPDRAQRRKIVHAAKIQIDRSGRLIGHEAVQLHGGVGMTMEFAVGHYLRRLAVIRREITDTEASTLLLAAAGGLVSVGAR